MSEINITVQAGSTIRLLTAGKYCDRDIVITALGEPLKYTVTLTNGHTYSQFCYISYDGNIYYTEGDTFAVPSGAVINCYASAGSSNSVFVDGESVTSGVPVNYKYTVTSDIEISFDVKLNSGGKIYIKTEEEGEVDDNGSTSAVLGKAVLGKAILGNGNYNGKIEKLETPTIHIETENAEVNKLETPTIHIETENEVEKLQTPIIELRKEL